MVFVNNKKFACQSCIKGHRSSSCTHTDRPLFEIKKKGRPVSQCEKCRELRNSRRIHSKCTCEHTSETPAIHQQKTPLASGSKQKRFIPIVPALPNGLKDVLQSSRVSASLPADPRNRVDTLLNPCLCDSARNCQCRSQEGSSATNPCGMSPEMGLDTLATAAAMRCRSSVPTAPMAQHSKRLISRQKEACCKRTKHECPTSPPVLPPIIHAKSPEGGATQLLPGAVPEFQVMTMPSVSTIASLASSGCTCGLQCGCPGCVLHRGEEHASKNRKDCHEGCDTCVDHSIGISLPGEDGGLGYGNSSGVTTSDSSNGAIDKFLKLAATLPRPPSNRRPGLDFDPMNITVYPPVALEESEKGAAFGLVNIPKLECCGGRCKCPDGSCGCHKSCDGRCSDHDRVRGVEEHSESERGALAVESDEGFLPVSERSCCS